MVLTSSSASDIRFRALGAFLRVRQNSFRVMAV
jgi:hypothetical protein